jgi:hypothetical protein
VTPVCTIIQVKVMFTLEQATKAQRRSRGVALTLSLTLAADWGGWSVPHPGRFTPGKTWYPMHRRLGGPQGRSGQVQKILPQPGFDPWTVQSIASHYTD